LLRGHAAAWHGNISLLLLNYFSNMNSNTSSLSGFFRECDGDDFCAVQGAVKRRLVIPNKQTATQQYAKTTPSRRVASQNGICGVANLGNGITIACDSRLASIRFGLQRIS
jgi:hypothetical protein